MAYQGLEPVPFDLEKLRELILHLNRNLLTGLNTRLADFEDRISDLEQNQSQNGGG